MQSAARLPQIYDASKANPYGGKPKKPQSSATSLASSQGSQQSLKPAAKGGAYKDRAKEPMVF